MPTAHTINLILGGLIFVASGIGHGTVQLTGMIPAEWQPTIKGWSSFISWVGTGYLTAVLGFTVPGS